MSLDEKSYGNDLPSNSGTTGYLTYGAENAYGTINFIGDTDWYLVRTDIGSTYGVYLSPTSFDGTSSPGANFDIRDRFGNRIANSDASGHWTGVAGDTVYYIEVRSPSIGGYSVRADNFSVGIVTSETPFFAGNSDPGFLSYTGQDDSYTVYLAAGTTYYAGLTTATLADPFLALKNPLDQVVMTSAVTPGHFVSYTPVLTGTYTLHVSSNSLIGRGGYVLTGGDALVSQTDTTLNQSTQMIMTPYSGPVAGLNDEFISISSHNLNLSTMRDSVFLKSGAGNDALQVTSGSNVLDGGTGSNFLVGGTGHDTFFVDDRSAPADIWSTVNNFHAGDAATIWGLTPQDFNIAWVGNQGAAGFTGLTLHATAAGKATASLTLVGYSTADLSNGRLTVSFGQVGGSNYMYVHGN
jgi:Ca2+-binding RTX toxin-like protein